MPNTFAQMIVQSEDLPLAATQQRIGPSDLADTTSETLELLKHAQRMRSFIENRHLTFTLILPFYLS